MGRVEDRLKQHPVHDQLRVLRAQIEGLTDKQRATHDGVSPEDTLARSLEVIDYVEGLLTSVDASIVTTATLDNLSTQAQTAVQYVGQPSYAANLDGVLDAMVTFAGQLASAVRLPVTHSRKLSGAFGGPLRQTVDGLQADAERVRTDLDALSARLADRGTDLDAQLEQQRADIEARLEELRTGISAEKQRLDSLVPQFEQQFKATQDERATAHEEQIAGLQERDDERIKALEVAAAETYEQLERKAGALLGDVAQKRDQVNELYAVITNTGTAGAYRDTADAQREQADGWRYGAVGFAVLAAAATFWAAIAAGGDNPTQGVIARIALGIAAGTIAAYAARQSGRHRNREEEAKRIELDLTSFGPFIESLPEDEQVLVRKQLADRMFTGRTEAPRADLLKEGLSVGHVAADLVQSVRRDGGSGPTAP